MHCNYCDQPATARIPSAAGEVCLTHAISFWTGLLAYARDHAPAEQALSLPVTTARRHPRRAPRAQVNAQPARARQGAMATL